MLRDGVPVPLMPKAYEILALLIEKHGRLVEKEEILNEVWQGRFVEESNVAQNVHQLRKALGDSKHGPSHIETVPGRGYRFTAEVRESSPECDAPRLIYGDGARPAGETGGEPPPPARVGGLFLRGFNLRVAALALACLGSITAATMLWPRKEIAPEHAPRSLAVLPFRLVGPAGDDETLGLGLADALITKLSNSNTLPVLPTSSVFRFIEREHDPLEVGRELRVTTVLSGTVQRTGERVRVTVQLVDVAERRSLWAGSFDSRYANIFELQELCPKSLS
ncbi:MAG TPA: winged helix-turn-helix domain-containing protein [Pyrinomonadaceae bacterium]